MLACYHAWSDHRPSRMKYFRSFVGLMQLAKPTSHYEFQPQLSSKSLLHSKNLNKHEAKPAVDPFAYTPNHDEKSSSEGGRRTIGETRVGKRKSAGDVGGQATSRKTALPICQKGMHPAAARSCRRGISASFPWNEQWIHGLYGSALRWYQLAPPQNVNPLDTPIGLDALYAFNARQPYSQPWTQSIKCHCPRYVLF